MNADASLSAEISLPRPARRWRFSLLTLILGTALGLAVLANFIQFREAQVTKQYLWRRHHEMAEELNGILRNHEEFNRTHGEDASQIHVSLVPTGSEEEWLWQLTLPEKQSYRLKFATKGISGDGAPTSGHTSRAVTGPTWLNVRVKGDSVVIALQSFRGAYGYDPHRLTVNSPIEWHGGLYDGLHNWSIAGQNRRESFDPEAPLTLLRMRTVRREEVDASQPDAPGPGFMIWLEKLPKK